MFSKFYRHVNDCCIVNNDICWLSTRFRFIGGDSIGLIVGKRTQGVRQFPAEGTGTSSKQ